MMLKSVIFKNKKTCHWEFVYGFVHNSSHLNKNEYFVDTFHKRHIFCKFINKKMFYEIFSLSDRLDGRRGQGQDRDLRNGEEDLGHEIEIGIEVEIGTETEIDARDHGKEFTPPFLYLSLNFYVFIYLYFMKISQNTFLLDIHVCHSVNKNFFVALVKEKGSDKEKKKENEDVKDYLILKKELLVVSKRVNFLSNSIHMLNFALISYWQYSTF